VVERGGRPGGAFLVRGAHHRSGGHCPGLYDVYPPGFLTRNIILPLEAIASANRAFQEDNPGSVQHVFAEDAPREIREIIASREQMLQMILDTSRKRLRLVNFIRETFGRYLSEKIVDQILESQEGQKIGGQRKTVTILMSDLRGFTRMSEKRDPGEMVRILNRYLGRMSEIIVSWEGIIEEIIGDAILAVGPLHVPLKCRTRWRSSTPKWEKKAIRPLKPESASIQAR